MNVSIKCDLCGEMQFEMSEEKATQIIGQCCMFASEFKCDPDLYEEAVKDIKAYAAENEQEPKKGLEKPTSKVERMFGDVKSRIPISAVMPKVPSVYNEDSYKGFLYIKCDNCGSVRGFFAKNPQSFYHCACGSTMRLKNLKTMYPRCVKCGATFKYMTNLTRERFEYTCLDCGSPIDMVLNGKGTTYING